MLSTTLEQVDGMAIGEHPLVANLMKGCYNQNPPKPRYESTWSVSLVLEHTRGLDVSSSLDVAVLTCKLATRSALCTCLRASEINSIPFVSVRVTAENLCFSLGKPRKSQHSGQLQKFTLTRNQDRKTCPVECMDAYLNQTQDARAKTQDASLFLSLNAPSRAVTPSTMGRWIKSFLNDAGVDTSRCSAQSTRGAAASSAAAKGMAVDSILRAAHWSSERVFARFYQRPLPEPNLAETILEFEVTPYRSN